MSYEYNLGTIKHLSRTSDLTSMQCLRIRFIEQPKRVFSIHFYDIHFYA